MESSEQIFMGMTLDLARLAAGRTSPNPLVGAVIVKNGKILATGYHRRSGAPHAEIEAINSPPLRVRGGRGVLRKGATLYVNLEPCCHHGRTPPCTDAIIRSDIREVVIGMKDPDPKVSGRGIKILRRAGIKVRQVSDPACEKLNEAYLKHRRHGLPFVILKAAATLDGKMSAAQGGKWITGPAARAYGHSLRDEVDAILVGWGTVLSDNPRLTTRLPHHAGKDPIRIILDTHLSIPVSARIFHLKSVAKTCVATVPRKGPAYHRKRAQLERLGVEVLACRKDAKGRVALRDLLRQLAARGVLSLLVEGGPTVHASFIQEKLADKLYLFLAPTVIGPGLSLSPLPRLRDVSCRMVGSDILIAGYF